MGAFCVFGVSRGVCLAKAEKKQPSFEWKEELRVPLSLGEWAARRDALAAELFEKGRTPVKVSPEFDAPQFCQDWLSIAPSQVRMAKIMVRGPKKDKHGNPVKRDGAPVMTWIEYGTGGAA